VSAYLQSIAVANLFALPEFTGTTSAAAMQSHVIDLYGNQGRNGRVWRRLRATNHAKMVDARRFGTKFGLIDSLPIRAPQRGRP
jgi:hypothetical protein